MGLHGERQTATAAAAAAATTTAAAAADINGGKRAAFEGSVVEGGGTDTVERPSK